MTEDEVKSKFMTPSKFSEDIETIVKDGKGLVNYIDAIVAYCNDNDIELETVPKLLSKTLKERLRWDAQRLNFMKKTTKGVLPL